MMVSIRMGHADRSGGSSQDSISSEGPRVDHFTEA